MIARSVASRGEADKATDHLARRWRKITAMLGEHLRRTPVRSPRQSLMAPTWDPRWHARTCIADKQAALAAFRAGEVQVLVSTDVGSEGHDLQHCHRLVNFDLPRNPMVIEQRIGRLPRFGQTSELEVFNLCARGSMEERILGVLHDRVRLFELVVGEMDMVIGDLGDRGRHDEARELDHALFGEEYPVRIRLRRRKGEREIALHVPPYARAPDALACVACPGTTRAPLPCDDALHILCEACAPDAAGRPRCPACRPGRGGAPPEVWSRPGAWSGQAG